MWFARSSGEVDYTSPELTPWLKLFVVTYDHEIERLGDKEPLLQDSIIDVSAMQTTFFDYP